MNSLFESAPDFSQPIAVLKHCHDRIRKQLVTLEKLPAHLCAHGADLEAQQAAKGVLRYFEEAAPKHHQDEEQDLLPMLAATATGADQATLAALMPDILAEHEQMDALWATLKTGLDALASGNAAALQAGAITLFVTTYQGHMQKEESTIAPMAKRLFSTTQMATLGHAMQRRRGIAVDATIDITDITDINSRATATGSHHVDQ